MKHEFVPVFGNSADTCYDCGQYLDEGNHYPYNDETELIDDEWEENTVLNYETDEGDL